MWMWIIWNGSLKKQKNMILTACEVGYVGTCFEIINEVGYSYDTLLKFGDYVTYCDVRYLCLWDGE